MVSQYRTFVRSFVYDKALLNTSKSLLSLFSLDLSDRFSCNTLLLVACQFGLAMTFEINHLLVKKKEGVA